MKTVGDLIDELSKHDRSAPLTLGVAWAGDTAVSEPGEISVSEIDGAVAVRGWLSGCDTALEVAE